MLGIEILKNEIFNLFLIIALGMALGALNWRGLTLGTAGTFFVALLFGHFQHKVPDAVRDLGLVLFVYAVGLHAGPRFVALLRSRGVAYLGVGLAAAGSAALAAFVLGKVLHISAPLTAGVYCGAVTNTPALAAVMDTVKRLLGAGEQDSTIAAVGYGVAYPFSVFSVVIIVQLLPKLLRKPAPVAAAEYAAEEAQRRPAMEACTFRVKNPNCAGRTIDEFQGLRLSQTVISRVKHEGVVSPARPETTLHLDDIVLAVGAPEELAKLEAIIGDVAVDSMRTPDGNIASENVLVSRRDVVGKSLRELAMWEQFGVVITRVRRDHIEFAPRGDLVLEPGDLLRVVGARNDVAAFTKAIGREERRLDETTLLPFVGGIVLGALIGEIPLPLPGGLTTKIGAGGGVFLMGLLLGHLGYKGPMRIYVPSGAKLFARDLGLVLFLAAAGSKAGEQLVRVVQQTGLQLVLAGAAVTLVSVVVSLLLMTRLLRWNMLSTAGALGACMTNPPAYGAATRLADSDAAAVAFASVYPVALIAKIVFAQLVFLALRQWG